MRFVALAGVEKISTASLRGPYNLFFHSNWGGSEGVMGVDKVVIRISHGWDEGLSP